MLKLPIRRSITLTALRAEHKISFLISTVTADHHNDRMFSTGSLTVGDVVSYSSRSRSHCLPKYAADAVVLWWWQMESGQHFGSDMLPWFLFVNKRVGDVWQSGNSKSAPARSVPHSANLHTHTHEHTHKLNLNAVSHFWLHRRIYLWIIQSWWIGGIVMPLITFSMAIYSKSMPLQTSGAFKIKFLD